MAPKIQPTKPFKIGGGVDLWSLHIPEQWEHNKYRLSIATVGFFTDGDVYNDLATKLWSKLRHGEGQRIFGSVVIFNEDEEDIIDMTIDDLDYIMVNTMAEDAQ